MKINPLASLLDDLYLSNVDDEAARRLPAALSQMAGAAASYLFLFDPATGTPVGSFLSDISADLLVPYGQHYYRFDPWRAPILGRPQGKVVFGAELIPDEAMARSTFYNEFSKRLDGFHLLASLVKFSDDPAGPMGALTIQRPKHSKAFESEMADRLNFLLPHLHRAFQLRTHLITARTALADAAIGAMLAAIPEAALVCNGQGKVLHANGIAEDADRQGGLGLALKGADSNVAARDARQMKPLRLAIANAGRGGAGATVRIGDRGLALVAPLPAGFAARLGATPGLVLIIVRGATQKASVLAKAAASLFDLTTAESETVALLVMGKSPDEIAAARAVRITTIRSLLKRAIDKAEVTNLRELVAILAALPSS